MWQGLSWEARARVELQRKNLDQALELIGRAQAISEEHAIPLADWRIRATAAAICAASGLTSQATQHAQQSVAAKARLADSLPPGPMRANLLAH